MKKSKLSKLIERYHSRCGNNSAIISGVDINKQFIPTRANLDGTDVSGYYLVPPKYFACNLMHIGRDEKIPIAYNNSEKNLVVTSAYYVFRVNEKAKEKVLNEYLYIIFNNKEFDRLTWFNTDGSIRGNLKEDRFLDIEIPLPSIEEQRKVVIAWRALREIKEQNEAISAPLMQVCQSYIQELKHQYPSVEIGEFIEEINIRNSDNKYGEDDARGVNTSKEIQECKRIGDKLSTYKVVQYNNIVFNANIKLTQTTEKFAVGLYKNSRPCIVSNFYFVFKCNENRLLPEYLMLWITRDEFARYVKFISCSSIRDRFSFEDMMLVKIPLPPIKVQQAIVNIYNCANEAKKIAEEADKKSREICPALIQYVINK